MEITPVLVVDKISQGMLAIFSLPFSSHLAHVFLGVYQGCAQGPVGRPLTLECANKTRSTQRHRTGPSNMHHPKETKHAHADKKPFS